MVNLLNLRFLLVERRLSIKLLGKLVNTKLQFMLPIPCSIFASVQESEEQVHPVKCQPTPYVKEQSINYT